MKTSTLIASLIFLFLACMVAQFIDQLGGEHQQELKHQGELVALKIAESIGYPAPDTELKHGETYWVIWTRTDAWSKLTNYFAVLEKTNVVSSADVLEGRQSRLFLLKKEVPVVNQYVRVLRDGTNVTLEPIPGPRP